MKIFSHRIFLWDASIDFAYACKTLLINLTTMKSALTNSIRFVLFISIAALISSCSSSSNVADGGILQKRKYRKGVHLNILKKHKVQEQSIPDEVIAQNSKNEPDREAIDNAEVDKSAHSISAQHAPIEALEAHSAQNKTTTLNAFRRVFNRKKTTSTAADSPEKIERQNTLTSQYQKGGKTALPLRVDLRHTAAIGMGIWRIRPTNVAGYCSIFRLALSNSCTGIRSAQSSLFSPCTKGLMADSAGDCLLGRGRFRSDTCVGSCPIIINLDTL